MTKRCFVLREKLFGLAEFNEMLVFLLGGLFRLGKELLGALGEGSFKGGVTNLARIKSS